MSIDLPLKAYAGTFLHQGVWVELAPGYLMLDGVVLNRKMQMWMTPDEAIARGVLASLGWGDQVDGLTATYAADVGLVGTLMSDIIALDANGLPIGLRPPGPPAFWLEAHSSAN